MTLREHVLLIGHDPRRQAPTVPSAVRANQLPATSPSWASHNWAAARPTPHDVVPEAVNVNSGNLHFPGHAGDDTHRLCQITRFPAA
jgi:hypothetical protein